MTIGLTEKKFKNKWNSYLLGRYRIWCSTRIYFLVHYYSIYILEDLDIASCAYDSTIYTVKENEEIINTLEASPLPLFT